MPAGAARNGVDCALWDLAAKRSSRPVHALAGLPAPRSLRTAYTISLGAPDTMADAARQAARLLLKIKLGGAGDPDRLRAIRHAAPDAELIVDANEGWSRENLAENLAACADAGVTLVEQPLPATDDAALAEVVHPIPVCADESVHDRATLARLKGKYEAVNIKLDKAGGLTEALALAEEADPAGVYDHGRLHGLDIACDRARDARRATRPRRRSRWPAPARRRTGPTGCATKEARSSRPTRPCGGEGPHRPGRARPIQYAATATANPMAATSAIAA